MGVLVVAVGGIGVGVGRQGRARVADDGAALQSLLHLADAAFEGLEFAFLGLDHVFPGRGGEIGVNRR